MIITHPSNDSIVTNMTYTLKFEVNGAPFPNVTWYRDGEPIAYDNNVYLDLYDASLHFTNTLVTHTGVYYAEIANDYGSTYSDEATLIVTGIDWTVQLLLLTLLMSLCCSLRGDMF